MAKRQSAYAAKQNRTLASSHRQGKHNGEPRVSACPTCNPGAPFIARFHTTESIEGTTDGEANEEE